MLFFPGIMVLIIYAVVSALIWGSPETDQGPDPAIERIDDAASVVLDAYGDGPAIYVS